MELRKCFMIVGIALALTAFPVPAHDAFGQVTDENTSVPHDMKFKPRLGTYTYKVEFNKLDVINASIDIYWDGDLYKMQVKAETTGAVDKIFRLRYLGQSITDTDPLSPVETRTQQKVRSKEKFITMSFLDKGMIRTTEKKIKSSGAVSYDVKNYQTDRFTFDPFSLCYLVRALDWQVGKSQIFDIYTGKGEYELIFKCIGETDIEFGGEKRKVWEIVPDVKQQDDKKQFVEMKKKPSSMKILISADENRDILKMEASHTLGYFQVVMTGFQPADQMKVAALPAKRSDSVNESASSSDRDMHARDIPAPATIREEGMPNSQ